MLTRLFVAIFALLVIVILAIMAVVGFFVPVSSRMGAMSGASRLVSFHLYATDGYHRTADGETLYIWGYSLENRPGSATLPGPLLEVNEGDTVELTLTNLGPSREGVHRVPHTVHLHGLDVSQANDGVPETSPAVRVGESTTYTFVATHAGTYWYHCHVDTVEHLTMGMYGALVVHPREGAATAWNGGPTYDRAYTLLLSEADPVWARAVEENRTPDFNRFEPRYFFVNGRSFPDTMTSPDTHMLGHLGERVLIRLINAGYQWRAMHLHGFHFEVIATDGRPLVHPYSKDTLTVAPGERYDLLVTLEQLGSYPFHSHAILDNLNNGRYPGGLHTMLTVVAPGEPLPDLDQHTAHGHHHATEVNQEVPVDTAQVTSAAPRSFGGFPLRRVPPPSQLPGETVGPHLVHEGEVEIRLHGDRFTPERVTVPPGSSVLWVNDDTRTHNVVADGFSSPDIPPGGHWRYSFDQLGTYAYECANHRGMDGVITVRE